MEKEITITMRKDDLRSAQYDDYAVWQWCKSKKIKVSEPRDTKTKLFETLVITLKTPEEKLLFSCKWFGALEKLSNVPSNCNKPHVSNCTCGVELTTGWTEVKCCNICGKPIEGEVW